MNTATLALALALAAPEPAPPAATFELGRSEGLVALGAGLGLGVVSMTAFAAGLESERRLRAGEVRGEDANDALTQRAVAAWVAWPAAVLSVAGVGAATWLLSSEGE